MARTRLNTEETLDEMLGQVPKAPVPPRGDKASHSAKQDKWNRKMKRQRTRQKAAIEWQDNDHPGCQISGFLWVDRVPGNFHIQACSRKLIRAVSTEWVYNSLVVSSVIGA